MNGTTKRLRVRVTMQPDGFTYSLDPRDVVDLGDEIIKGRLASKMTVFYGENRGFEFYHDKDSLLQQIVIVLTNKSLAQLARLTDVVIFVDAADEASIAVLATR